MKEFFTSIIPIVAIVSTIALPIILGVYYAIKTQNQKHIERMELIKQGLIPPSEDKDKPNRFSSLKNALVLIAIGIGLIIGLAIADNINLNRQETFWVVGPSVVLFLGAAHLIYFFLAKKYDEKDLD